MAHNIPIVEVDITSSQEIEIEQPCKKRKETIHIVDSTPKRLRSSENTPRSNRKSPIDKADTDLWKQKLSALEKTVKQVQEQQMEMDHNVTREEFNEYLGRISRVEERLTKIEQLLKNLKSVFMGTNVQTKHKSCTENTTTKTSNVFQRRSSIALNGIATSTSTEMIGEEVISPAVNVRPVQNTSPADTTAAKLRCSSEQSSTARTTSVTSNKLSPPLQSPANDRATSQSALGQGIDFPQNVTITAVAPRKPVQRGASENAVVFKPVGQKVVAGQSGGEQQPSATNSRAAASGKEQQPSTSTVHQRAGPSSFSGRDQWTPQTPQRSGSASGRDQWTSSSPRRSGSSTNSGNDHQFSRGGPSRALGRKQSIQAVSITSSNLTTNLSQILKEAPSEWCGKSAFNMDDLSDDQSDQLITRIRIKQEVLDGPRPTITTSSPFRKDSDDRLLVYIDGDSRKMRNHDIFAAAAGASLSDKWDRILPYISDLYLPNVIEQGDTIKNTRKLSETVRKQTEVIAACVAIQDIKNHTDHKRVTIVAQCYKLISIMSQDVHNVYPLNKCKCPRIDCSHRDRWETIDNFAAMLPDDLPRLILATEGLDIVWRNYKPLDLEDSKMGKHLKAAFKKEITALLANNQPRKK